MATDSQCVVYARECVRLADQSKDLQLRDQLLNMAREWMAAAMHELKVPAAKTGRGEESRANLRPSSEKELLMPASPMNSDQRENRLLKTLDWADFDLLAPHFRQVSLKQGSLLQEQEAPVERVYFPLSGVISLISVMEGGEVVETATVGREGAVGAFGGLGPWRAFTRAVVQLPGTAAVISVSQFQTAVSQSNQLRNLILRYKEALLGQVQQTAACNALHSLEARLARWLLQTLDRADRAELRLTQDFMAQMLAVRRPTVTLIAGKLQYAGLIRYRRGLLEVLDRPRLEETACECYQTIRRRTDAVFDHHQIDRPEPVARAPVVTS